MSRSVGLVDRVAAPPASSPGAVAAPVRVSLVWLLWALCIALLAAPGASLRRHYYQHAAGLQGTGAPRSLERQGRATVTTPLFVSNWGSIYIGLDELKQQCETPERRRQFLESMVVDGQRIPWRLAELAFAFSLKDDDRDWAIGLFDTTLNKLLQGKFDANGTDEPALQFADEISEALSLIATEFDDVATSLMISRTREIAEDDLYEQGLEIEGAFVFGDPTAGVSESADRKRRDAMFKALCALRFVRLGLKS